MELFNNTYNILQLQANISKEDLKIKVEQTDVYCEKFVKLNDNCTKIALHEIEEISAASEESFFKIVYCIGVIFFILIGKHIISLLVKKYKKPSIVAPLLLVSSKDM